MGRDPTSLGEHARSRWPRHALRLARCPRAVTPDWRRFGLRVWRDWAEVVDCERVLQVSASVISPRAWGGGCWRFFICSALRSCQTMRGENHANKSIPKPSNFNADCLSEQVNRSDDGRPNVVGSMVWTLFVSRCCALDLFHFAFYVRNHSWLTRKRLGLLRRWVVSAPSFPFARAVVFVNNSQNFDALRTIPTCLASRHIELWIL